MRIMISALLPIFLLSACYETDKGSESNGFNIECENQPDGWTDADDTFIDANNNNYQISGKWYCKNEYLQTETDNDHIYGKLTVTKNDAQTSRKSIAEYTFITRDPQPQHVIIQGIDSNNNHIGKIQSLHTDFRFETGQKIFPQLLKMTSVISTTSSQASADYLIAYDANAKQVNEIKKSKVSSISNSIYTLDEQRCLLTPNTERNWRCNNYKADVDINKNLVSNGPITITTNNIEVNPSISLLEDPLQADKEIKRLADFLAL